ncbi:MAG TPA: DHA2 family efflux MFS transporter permease subunit [Pseudonocardiaceae bacterium]
MTDVSTDRSRWLALYVLCAGMLMIILDATIVNVALPSIKHDLGFSPSGLAWVVNAYLIAFGGLLLLAGRLGDLLGQRHVFLAGLGVFTVASLLCGLAPNQTVLVAARFVQGLGGALTSAVVLGMIVTMFPEPAELAKAIGVYGFVASAGGSIGLLAGGALTSAVGWHWIFFVNLPVGVVAGFLARRFVPSRPGIGVKAGADIPGAALLIVGLMLGVYTILQVSAMRTLELGAAVALLVAFLVRQARIANPLMPLRLFRSRNVSGANVIQALLAASMFGVFFLGALYLQQVLGYNALGVGLAFLPTSVVMGAMSLRFAAPIAARLGMRTTVIIGLGLIVAGLLLFARTPTQGSYLADVLPAAVLLGAGAGLSFPPLTTLAMSSATPRDAGLASGLMNTTVQVGGAVGLSVLATLAAGRTDAMTQRHVTATAALNAGYHLAYLVAAALMTVAVVVAAYALRPVTDATAELDGCTEPAFATN